MISNLLYHSRTVNLYDANWSSTDGDGRALLHLAPGSIAFIRSGQLRLVGASGQAIDSNHFLVTMRPVSCQACGAQGGSCTVFLFTGPRTASTFSRLPTDVAVSLSSPELFLGHWHTLCWARSRPMEAILIERGSWDLQSAVDAALECSSYCCEHHGELADPIRTRLNANVIAPIGLEKRAWEVSLNPSTLSRAFHREVGISIRQYSKRLRLRKALQLMLDTGTDLGSIAVELGFFDQAHFSNAFHREFGVPPSLVRAVHRRSVTQSLPVLN
jgi:AraC-like DNA-binding protein